MYLEARNKRKPGICQTVVTDSDDSDDEMEDWFPVSDAKIFDYRTALNRSALRPESDRRPVGFAGEAVARLQPPNAAGHAT